MKAFKGRQTIGQLEARKGGYFFLKIDAQKVETFPKGRHTRLICTLQDELNFQCGLNHLGDGNFFVILSGKNLKQLGKGLGDEIAFTLAEDPNPLGVEMPETLSSLLAQDEELKGKFDALTDGKRRSIIHQISRIKNLDLQVARTIELINDGGAARTRRRL